MFILVFVHCLLRIRLLHACICLFVYLSNRLLLFSICSTQFNLFWCAFLKSFFISSLSIFVVVGFLLLRMLLATAMVMHWVNKLGQLTFFLCKSNNHLLLQMWMLREQIDDKDNRHPNKRKRSEIEKKQTHRRSKKPNVDEEMGRRLQRGVMGRCC